MKHIFYLAFLLISFQLSAQTIIVDARTKDTTIITTKDTVVTKSVVTTTSSTIKLNVVTFKPYKDPGTTPVPVPTGKYLTLPVSNKIELVGKSNVIIENLRFENVAGTAIILTRCTNVTIRGNFFNKATEEAISAENCTGVLVEKNLFNGVASGVYALGGSNVRVINNQNMNPHVRPQGGRGNLAQFDGVTNGEVSNNVSVAWPGENNTEDHISLFRSSGVQVKNNTLVGGGTSASGSGIMTGDYGGSNQTIENNILLSTGSVGIGVAGGSNITVRANKIFGERTPVSNNPLYVWAQQGAPCSNNTVVENFVTWVDKNGNRNGGWNAGNCPGTNYNESLNKPITLAELGLPSDWNLLINFITPAEVLKIRGK